MHQNNFIGRNSFEWFVGVVEDRQDPMMLGRVRVRPLGLYTEDKNLIPSEDLPWAHVMQPITSAAMCGVGEAPLGPVPGTWVVGFFRDGENAQDPFIMGTFGGIPIHHADASKGFSDPRDSDKLDEKLAFAPKLIAGYEYPNDGSGANLTEEHNAATNPRTLTESDVNRLARNENIDDTIVAVKNGSLDTGVYVALEADEKWDQPESPYNATYPYNHVKESESGHIEEVDDTPNNERLHKYHRTGTFEEIYPDGTKVTKIVMDEYEVTLRDKLVHIQGVCNVTIDGNCNLYVGNDANIEVNNDLTAVVKNNSKLTTFGQMEVITADDVHIWNQSDCNIITEGDTKILAKGDAIIHTQGDTKIGTNGDTSIATMGNTLIDTGGDTDISSTGSVTVQGGALATLCAIGPVMIHSETLVKISAPIVKIVPPPIYLP